MKHLQICLLLALFHLSSIILGQVVVEIDASAPKKPISPYIYGKNNSLSDNGADPLTKQEWQYLRDLGIKMFRENGGNNATKYNWRRKLSSHPDWYNNVYSHNWDFAAASLQANIPTAQGMWAFQLIGKAAKTSSANFNDWGYNRSQYWSGVRQNLAGGGQLNPNGGEKAIVDGNPSLYLEDWNADSTAGILNHWFGEEGIGLDTSRILYWSMDNEPEIWNGTHDDVWPQQPGAEQFMQMYFAVAKKARSLFPGIKLLGPVPANEWQWYNWDGGGINYGGKLYPWLEYFIKRIAEEQQASGIRLLDVLDIHFYPGETNPSDITQLHRVFFDTTYNYPGANGVRRLGASGWDNSISKEYIFKRCSDWLNKYLGPDHGVKFAVTETALQKRDNPSLTANWYASTLGEFARQGVEIFTPWDWITGMSEVVHLFTHYGKENILPASSSDEYYVSAYPTVNINGDSMTIFLVNRHLTEQKNIEINFSNFYIKDSSYTFYSLSNLPSTETFVSHTSNALKTRDIQLKGNWIDLTLDPLSVSAIVLKKDPAGKSFHIADDLIDDAANQETRDLYDYLNSQFGRRIISGQTHDYYDSLKKVAAKLPMLRAGDFQHFTQGYPYLWVNGIGHTYGYDGNDQTVNSLINWYKSTGKKGIVSMQWHWHDPLGDSTSNVSSNTFYTSLTNFDIRRAVIPGTLEYNCVIRDIDSIATQLKKFQSAGVPVLWRPLHEAGGGWFWWGAHGPEPCLALWDILIDRLKNHHQLHNLIWVWSSPEADWYPGNDKVDMIGYDSYPGVYNYTNQKGMFDNLHQITQGNKLIAMTENGPIPDPDACISGGAPWLYFMSWSNLVTKQNSAEHIREVYSNPGVLSIALPKYKVTIKVLRSQTNEPLNVISVKLGDQTKVTNSSGEVEFEVEEGSYDYIIAPPSYQSKEGSFEISSDTTLTVLLQQTHARIRIRLREGTRPVISSMVVLENDTLYTNSVGEVLFQSLPVSILYSYTVKKNGYEELNGDIFLTTDTTVLLQMTEIVVSTVDKPNETTFQIWPVPAKEYLNFSLPEHAAKGNITITNLSGLLISTFETVPDKENRIDLRDMKPGAYIIQIKTGNSIHKGYFIKL